MSLVKEETILPNAPATITAVARLTMSPFKKNDLKSLKKPIVVFDIDYEILKGTMMLIYKIVFLVFKKC